jgi:hypothetical protein
MRSDVCSRCGEQLCSCALRSVDVSPKLHEQADTRDHRLEVEHKLLLKCNGAPAGCLAVAAPASQAQRSSLSCY